MAAFKSILLCSLLWIHLRAGEGKEFTVTCMNPEECVLPCEFQSDGKGARIMWYKKKAVVSCTRYGNTSFVIGHNSQADNYRGRTDLFADQVLGGNATLLLRNVTPNDQGKYFCITMTAPRTDESGVISLVIKAPVRNINMEFNDNSVTCSAGGIFPMPALTWSTDPPSDVLQTQTKADLNHLGFYDIQSSLTLTEKCHRQNQTFICCVTSETNKKTAFLKHGAHILVPTGNDINIPCSWPHDVLQSFNLSLKFRHSDPILFITMVNQISQVKIWDQWKPHVSDHLSASSSLILHHVKPEHQGTYSCEVYAPEETYITQTEVIITAGFPHMSTTIVLSCVSCSLLGILVFFSFKRETVSYFVRRSNIRTETEDRRDESRGLTMTSMNGMNGAETR